MYHLSFANLGIKTILDIKKPNRSYLDEKNLPERVCFAPTIEQCIYGIEGIFDNNKETAFGQVVESLEHNKNMILSDYPNLIAKNKEVFPDLAVDVVTQDCFKDYPNIFKKHFIRKHDRLIELYEKYVFSNEYYLDRAKNFFARVSFDNTDDVMLNLTCYQTKEKLIKPDMLVDFCETGEAWSLRPILVERVGFISTLDLMVGKVVVVEDNISIK
jgi:hypothetical protein